MNRSEVKGSGFALQDDTDRTILEFIKIKLKDRNRIYKLTNQEKWN